MDLDSLTPGEIVKGYVFNGDSGCFECVVCGKKFAADEVFPVEGKFFTAEKAVKHHIKTGHPERIRDILLNESGTLSLTEKQKELMALFASGLSDSQVAKSLGVAPSTVRHQRFVFKEKAKSAKLYLALWELTQKNARQSEKLIDIHEGAKMIDDRYMITQEEEQKILGNVFSSLQPLKLKVFSSKEKKKIVALRRIAREFEPGRTYSENEVNEILKSIYDDYATLRRYLYEYGYMDRTRDCSEYRVNETR